MLSRLIDLLYLAAVATSTPVWMARHASRRKATRAFSQRMGRDLPYRTDDGRSVLIHAVSVGEVNAAATLVRGLLDADASLSVTLTSTTDTGFARASSLFGNRCRVTVIRYPLDFSAAVRRTLDARRPDVAVLMEGEVWPNWVGECARRGTPVVLANGRMTTRSFSRYRLLRPLASRLMFGRLTRVLAQEPTHAERYIASGVPPARVEIVGTMKFDTAATESPEPRDVRGLADAVGLRLGDGPIWVCGSTGPGEEAMLLDVYHRLLVRQRSLRLVLVPRKPERFDEVARLVARAGFRLTRRSTGVTDSAATVESAPVVLLDSMGELRTAYALADVVFVGRSLIDLGPSQHGSDMIEPAALGKPVIVGPYTGNFAEPMNRLREAGAVTEVADTASLLAEMATLLTNPDAARTSGIRALHVVERNRGATRRHLEVVLHLLAARRAPGGTSATAS